MKRLLITCAIIFTGILAFGVEQWILGIVIIVAGCIYFRCSGRYGGSFRGVHKETGADRYLKEAQDYYRQDRINYQQKQKRKHELLEQARILDEQARYGSEYSMNQKRQEAQRLRREADSL